MNFLTLGIYKFYCNLLFLISNCNSFLPISYPMFLGLTIFLVASSFNLLMNLITDGFCKFSYNLLTILSCYTWETTFYSIAFWKFYDSFLLLSSYCYRNSLFWIATCLRVSINCLEQCFYSSFCDGFALILMSGWGDT